MRSTLMRLPTHDKHVQKCSYDNSFNFVLPRNACQHCTRLYRRRYGITGWRVIRLGAHKNPVESTFHGLRALVPTTVETCRTKRRPRWRDMTSYETGEESGKRGEMPVTNVNETQRLPWHSRVQHIMGTTNTLTHSHAVSHWYDKREIKK